MLLVVDGSNLLFQMYYGMPARILGRDGRPIQGTLGFIGALGKVIRRLKPDYAVVLFDGECHNERTDIDPNYKANRPDYSELEETPFSQLPDIFRALTQWGIPYRETTCCEADDWIAGYAKQYTGLPITILSQDSDFFQLITDNVTVFRYRGESSVLCDRAYIREKLGIEPEQYADWKAMVGDSADNIKGANKIGPKTAAELLNQFETLENILENTEAVKKPSIRKSLQENKERLLCNHKLIALTGDVALPFAIEELACRPDSRTTTELLRAIGLR